MTGPFEVVVGSGSRRSSDPGAWTRPHAWTSEGVSIVADLNGAHLLLLAVATCVLNDCYRESSDLGVRVQGVSVRASGSFDRSWACTGVDYDVEVDSDAPPEQVEGLLARVEDVAEIPRAVRHGAEVRRLR